MMTIHTPIESETAAEAPPELSPTPFLPSEVEGLGRAQPRPFSAALEENVSTTLDTNGSKENAENHFRAALTALHAAGADAAQGWTPQRQSRFLSAIADGATVQDAAAEVGLSRRSAYALRRRAGGQAFDLGWQAADLLACDSLRETLWDRARNGQSWTTVRDDGERVVTTTRHRFDNRLALSMLTRLEHKLADAPRAPAARMAGKFEHLLAHIEAGPCSPDTAALVDFLDPPPPEPDAIGTCESCEPGAERPGAKKPGADPADMTVVWYDPDDEQWLTLLPAPDGFDGEEHGGEKDGYYYRTLSEEEETSIAHLDPMQCRLPRTARAIAGESLRTDWFAAAARARRIEDVPGLIDEGVQNPLPLGGDDSPGGERGVAPALED